jgi:hypothetical protein
VPGVPSRIPNIAASSPKPEHASGLPLLLRTLKHFGQARDVIMNAQAPLLLSTQRSGALGSGDPHQALVSRLTAMSVTGPN